MPRKGYTCHVESFTCHVNCYSILYLEKKTQYYMRLSDSASAQIGLVHSPSSAQPAGANAPHLPRTYLLGGVRISPPAEKLIMLLTFGSELRPIDHDPTAVSLLTFMSLTSMIPHLHTYLVRTLTGPDKPCQLPCACLTVYKAQGLRRVLRPLSNLTKLCIQRSLQTLPPRLTFIRRMKRGMFSRVARRSVRDIGRLAGDVPF